MMTRRPLFSFGIFWLLVLQRSLVGAWSPSSSRDVPRQGSSPRGGRRRPSQRSRPPLPSTLGTALAATATATGSETLPSLYQVRTNRVAKAVAAGKSRWGLYENQLCSLLAGMPPIEEAQPSQQAHYSDAGTSLYDQRTEKLAAAAGAGKSRWGYMENQRATMITQGQSTWPSATPATTTTTVAKTLIAPEEPTAVPTAPKGAGATAQSPSPASTNVVDEKATWLYQQRAQQVVQAAAAGKSRWGSMHVEKANNAAGLHQALSTLQGGIPEAPAAPALDPAVPLSSSTAAASASSTPESLFDQRNAKVAAAAALGQSRWGSMENEKAAMSNGLQQAMTTMGVDPTRLASAPRGMSSMPLPPAPPAVVSQSPPPPPPPQQQQQQEQQRLSSVEVVPEPSPADSSSPVDDIMAQLAREWAAMNSDHAQSAQATFSPVQASSPPPTAPPVQPAFPSVPPKPVPMPRPVAAQTEAEPTSATTSSFSSGATMEDLAREWASMTAQEPTPAAAPVFAVSPPPLPEPAPAPWTPPEPVAVVAAAASAASLQNDWDRLAQEWRQMNSDKDA